MPMQELSIDLEQQEHRHMLFVGAREVNIKRRRSANQVRGQQQQHNSTLQHQVFTNPHVVKVTCKAERA